MVPSGSCWDRCKSEDERTIEFIFILEQAQMLTDESEINMLR